jgi:hypothetical protein
MDPPRGLHAIAFDYFVRSSRRMQSLLIGKRRNADNKKAPEGAFLSRCVGSFAA